MLFLEAGFPLFRFEPLRPPHQNESQQTARSHKLLTQQHHKTTHHTHQNAELLPNSLCRRRHLIEGRCMGLGRMSSTRRRCPIQRSMLQGNRTSVFRVQKYDTRRVGREGTRNISSLLWRGLEPVQVPGEGLLVFQEQDR